MPDADGYPEDDELERIRNWSGYNWNELIDFVRTLWWPQGNPYGWTEEPCMHRLTGQPGRKITLSTGGWSGNEEIITALQAANNGMFWAICWLQNQRGGHYIFEVGDLS